MSNDFILNVLAALNKQMSKRQLKSDLKSMDNSLYVKVIAKIATALSKQQLKKDLKKLNDLYVQIGANVKVDKNTKAQLQNRIKELQKALSELEINMKVPKARAFSEVDSVRREIQAKANKVPVEFNVELKRSKAIADIEYLGKRFSKLFTNVAAKQKYENILMSAYSISDETQLKSVRNQIAAFTSELKANGLASQSLGDKWRGLIDRSKNLLSAASIVTAIFSQAKQAVSTILHLDTVMTNLYKVQDQITSRDQFSGLLTKWNKLAQSLAVTTESLISSMEAWSKIGFNLDMSEQLAQITAIFEKTAEISNEKATSTLISAAQAFTEIDDLGVDDYVKRVEAVGNKINAIGNKYSISSEGIADGLQNASAALKVAGNDLDETIALITATNKIFQSPEEGSNMLKVSSMRLRGQVDALKEMGEDAEGVSTDLTKIQQQIYELTGNKVNIFEDEDTLKSTYQIILEIGEVFDSLSDRSQADLLEKMFGKQRASAGAALLLNYEELEKIKNDSMNAANSMAEEYSKYMESAEAHITIFKEKLVETYSTFMSGDLIKYTADLGSGILDLVNSTDLLKHGILAVLAIKIGKGVTAVGAAISTTSKQMNTLGSALQQIKNLPLDDVLREKELEKTGKLTKLLTEKNLSLLLSKKQLSIQDKINILSTHGLTEEEVKLKLEKLGLTTVTNAQSAANVKEAVSTNVLKGAMGSLKASIIGVGTSLKAAFMSNKIGFILTGITTIISVATTAISNHNQKLEEAHQKASEMTEAYKQQQSSLDSQIEKYKELKESLDKGNLSIDEARSIKEQLLEIQKSLVDSYGNEVSNLDLVNGKYREQLGLLSELTKEKANDYVIENRAAFEDAKKELEKIKTYNIAPLFTYDARQGKTDIQKNLQEYIKAYSDLFDIRDLYDTKFGSDDYMPTLFIKANAEEADKLMHQFADDLEAWAKNNNIDESVIEPILNGISLYANKTMDDELKEYKTIYDEFMKAEVVRNDTLRPLYQQSIQAVEDYNNALSSGEGIAEAKANLDAVQQSVQNATGELEGSQEVFNNIYNGINKNAEAEYQMSQAFENDETIKGYAEQLRGLTDIDLQSINFEDTVQSPGEEAFGALIDILGLSEDEVQKLIDLLIKLGYVQGEVQKDISSDSVSFSDIFSFKDGDTLTNLGKISESIDTIQNAYKTLSDAIDEYNDEGAFSIDTLQSVISLGDDWLDYLVDEEGKLKLDKESLEQLTLSRLNDMRVQAINNLIDNVSKINNDASATEYLTTTNYALKDSYEAVGKASLETARMQMQAAVAAGTLSQENMDAAMSKAYADIEKINKLFNNTDFSAKSIKGGAGSSKSSKSEFDETIDFFERRVKVLDNSLSHLKSSLENVSGSFGKNNLIDAELNITGEKFRNYTDALSMYTQKANEALSKLPADIAAKVKDGAVALTDFVGDGNKDVVEAIKDYESWAGKVNDCKQELAELRAAIRQLELEKFNNIISDFMDQFDLRNNSKELISKQIDLLKESGQLIGESFFTAQVDQSKKQLELLENEKAQLVNQMTDAVSSGRVQKGTDEWLEMVNALNSVDGNILDCKKSIEEFDNELLSIHTEVFNRIQTQFSNLHSEISNINDLFDEFDISDDKGIWSKEAITQLGLLAQQYELSQYQIQQYNNEIGELNKQYLAGRYSATEYADKLADLNSAQWDSVKAGESAKDSIMELNKTRVENAVKGIEKEIESYNELTQSQIDALEASRDLHEYENSIAEKTKSVTDLERQIAAMQNDNSAATIAKRKRLEQQLSEAKKDLEESEYQHSVDTQKEALETQREEYEKKRNEEIEALRESLNDREAIIAESFNTVKENASLIGQEIATIATEHGITVSNSLISSWQSGEKAIASYGEILSQKTSAFIGNVIGVENEVWNLQTQANQTSESLAWMFSTKADSLVSELTTSYYSELNLQLMTQSLHDSLVNTLESGYDVSKIVTALKDIETAANSAGASIRRIGDESNYSNYGIVAGNGKFQDHLLDKPFQKPSAYASGTRSSKGNVIITDEDGYEIKLPKLSSGNYTIANEGTQILTKQQTDNIFEWAKFNPNNQLMDLWRFTKMPEIVSNNGVRNSQNIHYDSMFRIEGDVIDADRIIKRIEKAAIKITDQRIDESWRDFGGGVRFKEHDASATHHK